MPRVEWVDSQPTVPVSSIKPRIHNVFLLDTSPSMNDWGKFNNAELALRNQIDELRLSVEVDYTFSIFQFAEGDNLMRFIYLKQDGKVVPDFHRPNRGFTGLNDAIGISIKTFIDDKSIGSDQVIFKIFTDGGENASKQYTTRDASNMIQDAQSRNWVVTFLGTEADTRTAINLYGIDSSNTIVHNNTAEDVKRVITTDTQATVNYAKRIVTGDTRNISFYDNQ